MRTCKKNLDAACRGRYLSGWKSVSYVGKPFSLHQPFPIPYATGAVAAA
jgi:hypothetical protein